MFISNKCFWLFKCVHKVVIWENRLKYDKRWLKCVKKKIKKITKLYIKTTNKWSSYLVDNLSSILRVAVGEEH